MAMVTGPPGGPGGSWRSQQRVLGLSDSLCASAAAPALKAGPGLHSEVRSEVTGHNITGNKESLGLFLGQNEGVHIHNHH